MKTIKRYQRYTKTPQRRGFGNEKGNWMRCVKRQSLGYSTVPFIYLFYFILGATINTRYYTCWADKPHFLLQKTSLHSSSVEWCSAKIGDLITLVTKPLILDRALFNRRISVQACRKLSKSKHSFLYPKTNLQIETLRNLIGCRLHHLVLLLWVHGKKLLGQILAYGGKREVKSPLQGGGTSFVVTQIQIKHCRTTGGFWDGRNTRSAQCRIKIRKREENFWNLEGQVMVYSIRNQSK